MRSFCAFHRAEYIDDYGDDGEAALDPDNCLRCQAHPTGCICADCSGAELTSEND